MRPPNCELNANLREARTAPTIYEAAANIAWAKAKREGSAGIPSDADLQLWLRMDPDRDGVDSDRLLQRLASNSDARWGLTELGVMMPLPGPCGPPGHEDAPAAIVPVTATVRGTLLTFSAPEIIPTTISFDHDLAKGMRVKVILAHSIEAVHHAWLNRYEDSEPMPSPIVALIGEWHAWRLSQPVVRKASDRERIMPFRQARPIEDPAKAVSTMRTLSGSDPARPEAPAFSNGSLLGFASKTKQSRIRAPFPLLVDVKGDPLLSHSKGPGAPLAFRLWNEVTLSVPANDRSGASLLGWRLSELARLLWPNGRRWYPRYGAEILKAAMLLDRAAILIEEGESLAWFPIRLRAVPPASGPNDRIIFDVRFPTGSHIGPKVPRVFLREMGVRSAGLYRATFSLPYYWDRYGGRSGKLIQHDIPRRDPKTRGLLDVSGNPIRDQRGRLVVTPTKVPLGIAPGRDPNPARKRYPALRPEEIIEAVHGPGIDLSTSTGRRKRQEARKVMRELEELQYLILEAKDGTPVTDWAKRPNLRVRILPGAKAARR